MFQLVVHFLGWDCFFFFRKFFQDLPSDLVPPNQPLKHERNPGHGENEQVEELQEELEHTRMTCTC